MIRHVIEVKVSFLLEWNTVHVFHLLHKVDYSSNSFLFPPISSSRLIKSKILQASTNFDYYFSEISIVPIHVLVLDHSYIRR